MIPAYNKKRCAAFPFETGIHFRRKTDFFPEEDTAKSYSGFEPEPTRLQAEGHSHHTGWGMNEKVSNHGSIPITIDCSVVAFIVFEEVRTNDSTSP
ncbi:poly polymerase [Trichonephila clavipes]|nr:poly polymerase [Trichonephila clavipes]